MAAQPSSDGEPGPASLAAQPVVSDSSWTAVHVWRLERRARVPAPCASPSPSSRSFSTLVQRGKKHFSDVFYVGGCPWRLSLYPKRVVFPLPPPPAVRAASGRHIAHASPPVAQRQRGREGQPRARCGVPGGG